MAAANKLNINVSNPLSAQLSLLSFVQALSLNVSKLWKNAQFQLKHVLEMNCYVLLENAQILVPLNRIASMKDSFYAPMVNAEYLTMTAQT